MKLAGYFHGLGGLPEMLEEVRALIVSGLGTRHQQDRAWRALLTGYRAGFRLLQLQLYLERLDAQNDPTRPNYRTHAVPVMALLTLLNGRGQPPDTDLIPTVDSIDVRHCPSCACEDS